MISEYSYYGRLFVLRRTVHKSLMSDSNIISVLIRNAEQESDLSM
jgi:hypothetical protein